MQRRYILVPRPCWLGVVAYGYPVGAQQAPAAGRGARRQKPVRSTTASSRSTRTTTSTRPTSRAERNYTQRLTNQVNLPKMVEGGLDVSFLIVYVGPGPADAGGVRQRLQAGDREVRRRSTG